MPRQSSPPLAVSVTATSAKALRHGRTERPRGDVGREPYAAADLFDRACNLWGGTNTEIARWCGVSESIVRDIRSGHRVLTLSRLVCMPPELVRRVTQLLAEEVGHE